jgi:pimeloyl-ACP methyl ester carboxylesterase
MPTLITPPILSNRTSLRLRSGANDHGRLADLDGRPETAYARNGDVHIAYQVLGEGPLDLVLIESWASHVEAFWEVAELARQRRRLAAIGRLIMFDRRGTGLSDPVPLDRLPDLETQVSDVCAVLDAAGSRQAAVLGFAEGGPIAIVLAATFPERCRALVLLNTAARLTATTDYPWGAPEDTLLEIVRDQAESWAAGNADHLARLAPSRSHDPRFAEMFVRLGRSAISPGAVAHYYRQSVLTDVRDLLPTIEVPTLVLQRAHDQIAPPALGKYLAAQLPQSRYLELDGADHLWFTENGEEIVDEIEEFLTGSRTIPDPDRRLATILFTDIVGSTARAAELGDARWRSLLDEHDAIVRHELTRFGGTEVDNAGDGFLATFDGPGRAIRCAGAIRDVLAPTGLSIRAGVHTGEVEVRGSRIGGLAVHIGARVAATGGADEIIVSSTVKDLLAGSGLNFLSHGEHALKGVPGSWHLFAAQL